MFEKKIKIIEPSETVFAIIDYYKKIVQEILPNSKITLIGSFAIPVPGKNEFDLLVEVDNVKISQEKIKQNSNGRFNIGPIEDGVAYCRSNKKYGMVCELHILLRGHKKIKRTTSLVKKVKSNPELLDKYRSFKRSLNGSLEKNYDKEKKNFLVEHGLI